jgi:hypothetical protein
MRSANRAKGLIRYLGDGKGDIASALFCKCEQSTERIERTRSCRCKDNYRAFGYFERIFLGIELCGRYFYKAIRLGLLCGCSEYSFGEGGEYLDYSVEYTVIA